MGFRLKMIAGVAITQTVFMFVLIWNGLSMVSASGDKEIAERALLSAKLFANMVQSAVVTMDLASLDSLVDGVAVTPGVAYARVIGAGGKLAESGLPEAVKVPFHRDLHLLDTVHDGLFNVEYAIEVAGRYYGVVQIGFSTENAISAYKNTRTVSVVLAVVGIIAVTILTVILAFFFTRQMEALVQGTKQLSQGEFGYQVPIFGKDELARTALEFNSMSERLLELRKSEASRTNEIRLLNKELEDRVEQRTKDLTIAMEQLEYQALYDALTRIPNRNLFEDRLRSAVAHASRNKAKLALAVLDVNLFKEINDGFGHHAGDLALQHVAKACVSTLRDSDTVARLGGDEFYLILRDIHSIDDAKVSVERVVQAISQPFMLDGKSLVINTSCGIAMYPEHTDLQAELITFADIAMYEAKRRHGGIEVYQPGWGEKRNESIALRVELQRAISQGELVLHYQPKLLLDSGAISGVEALVRWQHPELGLLYPDRFISLAESTGMMGALTTTVIEMALRQHKHWQSIGRELTIAVNISASVLQDDAFPAWLESQLRTGGIAPHWLELEITETAIMVDPIRAIKNIERLAVQGIQVAIDDFGTGYSSMAYLQKLLIAKIKIDKTFVKKMGSDSRDEVIVRSTIDLAHNLGLKAIAEGVEDASVWDRLRQFGCDAAQGYFMSKPLPAEALIDWLDAHPRVPSL